MPLYKDNPNLGLTTVKTVQGDTEYRINCRYIASKYHTIGRDVFQINGVYYRVSTGKIEFNHERQQWQLKGTEELVHGIVDIAFDDNKLSPKFGYFSRNLTKNAVVNCNGSTTYLMDANALSEDKFIENKAKGIYYYKPGISAAYINAFNRISNDRGSQDKGYNIEDNVYEWKEKRQVFDNYVPHITESAKKYAKFLGELTFGLETETCISGKVPEHLQYRNGIIACRDGSLGELGYEWVSIPMSGAKGVQTFANIADTLKERADINLDCSVHIHIGNIPLSREYLVALYLLGNKIQDELFQMFPYYKTDPRGVKRKNYCKKLTTLGIATLKDKSKQGYNEFIDDAYYKLFMFLSEGVPPDANNNSKVHKHPVKNKWDRVHSRYFWINTQNMIFSDRMTCEHRLHGPSLNKIKIVNWLFICAAINRYAEKNIKKIITTEGNIPLKEVFDYYRNAFPNDKNAAFLSDYLWAYYESRKSEFQKDFNKNDYISAHDYQKDKEYTFSYKGVKSLV